LQYTLVELTTARIEITGVSKDIFNNCNYALEFHGFSDDEVISLAAFTPDIKDPQILHEEIPWSYDNFTWHYSISPIESAGNYLLAADGDDNSAMYVIEYDGECRETGEYEIPGPPPSGLPEAETSEYLQTNFGAFNFSIESWTASYLLSLNVLKDLPSEAYIEAHFENPLNPLNPIVIIKRGPQPKELELQSPSITGVKCKTYWVEVIIYSNPEKETELGRHVQWIKSTFDLDKVQSLEDIVEGSTCSP